MAATIDRLRAAAPLKALPRAKRLVAKSGAQYHVIDVDKVVSISAEDHYSVIRGAGREVLCDESLAELAERLGEDGFLRVHRGAIVNLAAVERMEREGDRRFVLVLRGGERVLVSRERAVSVRAALGIGEE